MAKYIHQISTNYLKPVSIFILCSGLLACGGGGSSASSSTDTSGGDQSASYTVSTSISPMGQIEPVSIKVEENKKLSSPLLPTPVFT